MIQVHTNIPYGNAALIETSRQGGRAVVSFLPDTHGGPETLWFALRIATEGRPVRLVLRQFGNLLGGGDPARFRPVARVDGRDWQRLEPGRAIEHADGRVDATWDLPAARQHIDVATCYPYGRPEVEQLLADTNSAYRMDTIGVSQGGRPILRLSNAYDGRRGRRPGIYVMARQHSAETPGSWVLDGFLRHMAQRGQRAPLVWAVPLTNIDGVEQGDYGKDNFPIDLNRAWGQPPMRHETLVMQRDMQRWRERCEPRLVLDFHAPGLCEDTGLYAYLPKGPMPDALRHAVDGWCGRIARAVGKPLADERFDRTVHYASRWELPTVSRYAVATLGVAALSFETAYTLAGKRVLTRELYRRIGQRIATAVCDGCAASRG